MTDGPDLEMLSWAEARCRRLYDGKSLAHRSCGVAMAETFDVRRAQCTQEMDKVAVEVLGVSVSRRWEAPETSSTEGQF